LRSITPVSALRRPPFPRPRNNLATTSFCTVTANTPDRELFEKLDIRVGLIVEAWPHPDSDKLWCERIDVGEEEPREIASGLRAYYASSEELQDRKVLVVCNLKPAKLGGFKSSGMVLCASSSDRSKVEFVEPLPASNVGERVFLGGATEELAELADPASPNQMKKKKIFQQVAEELLTNESREAQYQGHTIFTSAGPCSVLSIANGPIS
jgi:methionine--tRNA ligase beta chain